jgi:hypothetical protein
LTFSCPQSSTRQSAWDSSRRKGAAVWNMASIAPKNPHRRDSSCCRLHTRSTDKEARAENGGAGWKGRLIAEGLGNGLWG